MDTGRVVRVLAAAVILALVATACGRVDIGFGGDGEDCDPLLEPGVVQETSFMADADRVWQVAMPTDDPVGLIVDLHGTGGTIESQDAITRLSVEGPAQGYVVVTPQGLENPARWTVPGIPGPDDVAFIVELVADVGDRACVSGPAFATGKSSGAAMATQLACETNVFTGVAPVGGINLYRRCPEGDPVSVITFHGTEDAWVPYEGPDGWEEVEQMPEAFFIGDTAATVAAFRQRANCDDASMTLEVGSDSSVEQWRCPDGHQVAFYTIEGGGHTHPGAHARQVYEDAGLVDSVGHTTDSFDGTEVMLDLFESVRKNMGQ